ncbi:MAG: Bax inhibitor-1/YccA family protein [Bacteroidota bacterium]
MDNRNIANLDEQAISKAQTDFLSKVYAWMVGGLLLTGLTAWYTFTSGIYITIISSSMLWVLIIAELGLVMLLVARIDKLSTFSAGAFFLLYSLLNGLTLSVILAIYTDESIQRVFYTAAGMFGTMSLFGWLTKKDLSGMGRFMFMGLIGIIIASVVNIFMPISALNFAISVIGVVVFAGLTAYDTQKLKEMWAVQFDDSARATKASILGALTLYLDFINLFLFLLRIFGGRR